jgi:hypothetical protein
MLITHESEPPAPTFLFICHYSDAQNFPAIEAMEEVEKIEIVPLIRNVEYEQVGSRRSLFLKVIIIALT